MKPNKQKIFSTQPKKPGTSLSSRGQSISSSIQEFQLKSITKNLHIKSSSAPFKLLSFPDSPNRQKPVKSHIPPYPNLKHSNSRKSKSPQKPLSSSEDLNTQTIDSMSFRKEPSELYIRTFPNKYWCQACKKEVFSRVKLTLPQVNVWAKMCCKSCVMPSDKFQEILHFCPYCERVLENIQPRV